ncbi:MAG TPA: class I SAM-dependent methyltransferase [Chloroflexia bacterium]|nr:class I SAM-dependent methyltransferase [Chloroflexia bacterium]
MTEWYQAYYGADYAESVREIATPARAEAEVAFIVRETGLQLPAAVADVACGHGRHAVAFATRGFRVTGVDQNADFIAAGQAAAPAGTDLVVGDMRQPFGGPYNLITILFQSFGFFDDAENHAVLEVWSARLAPGGWFVLDVWNRDFIIRHFEPVRTWQASATLEVSEQRRFDPLSGQLTIHYRYRYADGAQHEYDGRFRLYAAAELRGLCEGAGLRVESLYGSLTGEPYDLDARRLIVFARKPG